MDIIFRTLIMLLPVPSVSSPTSLFSFSPLLAVAETAVNQREFHEAIRVNSILVDNICPKAPPSRLKQDCCKWYLPKSGCMAPSDVWSFKVRFVYALFFQFGRWDRVDPPLGSSELGCVQSGHFLFEFSTIDGSTGVGTLDGFALGNTGKSNPPAMTRNDHIFFTLYFDVHSSLSNVPL